MTKLEEKIFYLEKVLNHNYILNQDSFCLPELVDEYTCTPIHEKHVESDPYDNLMVAIVIRGILDFIEVIKRYERYGADIPESERAYWIHEFSSDWFESLSHCNGEKLYDQIIFQYKNDRWLESKLIRVSNEGLDRDMKGPRGRCKKNHIS